MTNEYFWKKKTVVSYVLAILVFWIHCSSFANYENLSSCTQILSILLQKTINVAAVPLFFIMSGASFYRDFEICRYKEKVMRRIKSLVFPYLLWNIINMVFNFAASATLSQFFVGREVAVLTPETVFLGIFHYYYNGPFWFIFSLIVFTFAAPLISACLHSKAIGVLSITALFVLNLFGIGLPAPLFYTRTCLIYYLVGGFIGRYCFNWFAEKSSKATQVASALGAIAAGAYFFLESYGITPGNDAFDCLCVVVLGLCLWRIFDAFISRDSVVPLFFEHSFWVYAMHINVGAVFAKIFYIALPKAEPFPVVNFILTTLGTLVVIEIVCRLTKRFFPRIYSVLSGSR